MLGNGADELIRLCAVATIDPGDRGVYPWPSFPSYGTSIVCCGGEPVPVPPAGRATDLDAVLAAVEDGGPRAKLVCLANPNNPTGNVIDPGELRRFLEQLPETVLCVLDEAYADYADAEPEGIALVREGVPRLAVLRTFSKVYGLASLRVGYALASAEVADALDRVRPMFNVSQPAQEAARASLHEREAVAQRIEHARRARGELASALAGAGLDPEPSQTNFVYADVPGGDGAGPDRRSAARGRDGARAGGLRGAAGRARDRGHRRGERLLRPRPRAGARRLTDPGAPPLRRAVHARHVRLPTPRLTGCPAW